MNKAITATALAAALLAGGTATATGLHKDVELSVDGRTEHVGAFALTVSDVLAARGITIGAKDVVTPSLDSAVADGQTVDVKYSKPVTLKVDGTPVIIDTTAATLSTVLADTAVTDLGFRLAVRRSRPHRCRGPASCVTVSTPKVVTLKVAGKSTEVTTTATTIADLLAEQSLSLSATDVVEPADGDAGRRGPADRPRPGRGQDEDEDRSGEVRHRPEEELEPVEG